MRPFNPSRRLVDVLRALALNATEEQARSILAKYDFDSNSTLDVHEFAVLVEDFTQFSAFDAELTVDHIEAEAELPASSGPGVVMVRSAPGVVEPMKPGAATAASAELAGAEANIHDVPPVRKLSDFLATGHTGFTPRDPKARRRSSATENVIEFLKNIGVTKFNRLPSTKI